MTSVEHIAGQTCHGRKGAVENAFRYSIDYVLLNPESQPRLPFLFRRNAAGLTSLHDVDHGGPPKQGRGAPWAREVLAAHGVPATGKLLLLAQPRMLGHVFNPVSFWLCHDSRGQMVAVIAEVSNTFGDRHSYLCVKPDHSGIQAGDRLGATKVFHVSPFQPVEGAYVFRFDIRADRIGIWIDYTAGNGGLVATLTGTRRPLTNLGILGSAVRRPLGARRVVALIHWQALRLWWKGAGYRRRPEPPARDVSQ
ncbi:DUF1365 domain-containing protein [Puniceibacterium sediminis]|uniref:Cyclopropane-fatty-acyl-phospholipid synthase n=1 Tax=Puniceibacterium sediminis TaxID=1608407 RepID=A0A238WR76_9RHOB|nr:DUF1365 domain-containing protein [Puniceibacterium sediminis]SNR48977.1 hypothetical protein SAMN06265370_10711 [Puniceibacterium sediminis]